jgi:hypothetical protein
MPVLPKQPRPGNKPAIRRARADEHSAARVARAAGDAVTEWRHLELAHILSQPLPIAHVRTHISMLGYAIRHRDRHEVVGQLVRLVVAAPGSALRRYPVGNTGGADVSAAMTMAIPSELQAVLDDTTSISRGARRASRRSLGVGPDLRGDA